jgi:hypothetical protein
MKRKKKKKTQTGYPMTDISKDGTTGRRTSYTKK